MKDSALLKISSTLLFCVSVGAFFQNDDVKRIGEILFAKSKKGLKCKEVNHTPRPISAFF